MLLILCYNGNMKIVNIHSNGGTCDRCGKGLVNVAVIKIGNSIQNVGLDCLSKVEISDFETKQEVRGAVKDARTLGTIKRLDAKGELQVKFEQAGGGLVAYYMNPKQGWTWLGLAEQNSKGLRKEIWQLVTK